MGNDLTTTRSVDRAVQQIIGVVERDGRALLSELGEALVAHAGARSAELGVAVAAEVTE